jgi:hypothetical protein
MATIVLDCQGIDAKLEIVPEITRNHQPAFLREAIAPRLPASVRLWFTLILPIRAGSWTALLAAQNWPDLAAGLEISRAARPWEFMDAFGSRAALLGNKSGRFDAWVYPLKILRDSHLLFHAEEHTFSADPPARTLIVRPESTTIVYASDTFTVRETLVVSVIKQGH